MLCKVKVLYQSLSGEVRWKLPLGHQVPEWPEDLDEGEQLQGPGPGVVHDGGQQEDG